MSESELFDTLADVERRVLELQKKYSALQTENALLKSQNDNQKTEGQLTQQRLSQMQREAHQASATIAQLEEEKQQLTIELENLQANHQALMHEMQILKNSAQNAQKKLADLLAKLPAESSPALAAEIPETAQTYDSAKEASATQTVEDSIVAMFQSPAAKPARAENRAPPLNLSFTAPSFQLPK